MKTQDSFTHDILECLGSVNLALLLALLLSACATGVPPRSPVIAMPAAFEAPTNGGQLQSLDHWWTLYDDPQLTTLTERALSNGFSVREAIARLQEAQALRSVALAQFNPQGNLQGNTEYRVTRYLNQDTSSTANQPGLPSGVSVGALRNIGASKSTNITMPVKWELDLFGRRAATNLATQADLDVAQFDIEAARAAIVAEVARTLFQTRGLTMQRDEALDTVHIQHELMRVVDERVRRGLAATSEADRVAGDVAQAEAQAAGLTAGVTASRRALLVVIGGGTDPLASIDVSATLGAVPTVPVTLPSELMARRPDVQLAAARIRRAAGNVRLAELNFFPQLTLNPGLGINAQRGLIDTTTGFWSIGAGLVVPILDRPRLQAQLDAEGARGEQAVLAFERTVQTAFSEADQSLLQLAADQRRVTTLAAGEIRIHRAYDAALKRYQLGFNDLTTALDAERAWRAVRVALVVAKLDALQRSVQLFQALGGGWNATAVTALGNPERKRQ